MAQTAQVKINEVSANEASLAANSFEKTISIRVSPNNYLAVFFLITFFTGFLVHLEKDIAAAFLSLINWFLIPALALSDKIVFDGKTLFRTGIIPKFWAKINHRSKRLKISQIEQVETQALRALKRGGNIFYRYRTAVQGNGLRFSFASGSEDYRQMVEKVFRLVPIDTLDSRSIELRDYLSEPKEVLMKAEFARIPSMEVLEDSVSESQSSVRNLRWKVSTGEISREESEKADELRQLANELRLSGNLLQSLEAFRRALLLKPFDAWLIFEFARCLHSYASTERSQKLIHKANAALRLAENRAGNNNDLLARIGESYFQYGDWKRAGKCFNKTLNATAQNFRAVRGLAEIALREGKIAHVIHHFATAVHFAETSALQRWAQNETEYFSRLNSDEDYMDSEIKRINRLENIERGKVTAMRLTIAGIIVILFGLSFDKTVANIGWTVSIISLLVWLTLIASRNILLKRSSIVEDKD